MFLCRFVEVQQGDERVGAVAALQSCGLALECGGVWVEWSARAVIVLSVASRPGPRCPVSTEMDVGFEDGGRLPGLAGDLGGRLRG